MGESLLKLLNLVLELPIVPLQFVFELCFMSAFIEFRDPFKSLLSEFVDFVAVVRQKAIQFVVLVEPNPHHIFCCRYINRVHSKMINYKF